MIKTVFKQLHLWLSIPFGLVVTLICLSGAILIFERDFGHIGQAKVSSNGRAPLPLDSILKSSETYLAGSNQIESPLIQTRNMPIRSCLPNQQWQPSG